MLCDAGRVDLALAAEPAGGVVALSLDAFGKGIPGLPAGVVDFAPEVRLHGDDFTPWEAVPGTAAALAGSTVAEVLADARGRASALGVGADDRVLSTLEWSTVDGVTDGLLAVLVGGGVAGAVPQRGPGGAGAAGGGGEGHRPPRLSGDCQQGGPAPIRSQ